MGESETIQNAAALHRGTHWSYALCSDYRQNRVIYAG